MASFYSLLNFMAVNGFEYSDPRSFDLINSLPMEVAVIIFRLLSGKQLLNAASVNKNWFNICKSDSRLRQKIRRYLRQKRKADIYARLFGNRRNCIENVTNNSVMMNVVNTRNPSNSQQNRLPEPSTPRYMPYRRQASFVATRVTSSRRKYNKVEENNVQLVRLRM